MFFATHQTFRRYVCRWRHKIRKIAVEILQSVNNRTQCLREIAILHMVIIDIII